MADVQLSTAYNRYTSLTSQAPSVIKARAKGRIQRISQMRDNEDGTFTVYWDVGKRGLGKAVLPGNEKVTIEE